MGKHGRSASERFWAQVDIQPGDDACWPWTGSRKKSGYGNFSLDNKSGTNASRAAYILTYGPIPDDVQVCHHCDNPPCCRPGHLFLGTAQDNMLDAARKGRLAYQPIPTLVAGQLIALKRRSAKSRLSPVMCLEIAERFQRGESNRQLARAFGVDHAAIIQARRWVALAFAS